MRRVRPWSTAACKHFAWVPEKLSDKGRPTEIARGDAHHADDLPTFSDSAEDEVEVLIRQRAGDGKLHHGEKVYFAAHITHEGNVGQQFLRAWVSLLGRQAPGSWNAGSRAGPPSFLTATERSDEPARKFPAVNCSAGASGAWTSRSSPMEYANSICRPGLA